MNKNELNILIIPAWYDASNPLLASFFHEYCEALAKSCSVSLLNINYYNYSQRDSYKIEKEDKYNSRNYELIEVNYKKPLPTNWFGLANKFQKRRFFAKVYKELKKHEKFDLIHIQSVCNSFAPYIARELSNKLDIPYIVTEHYSGFNDIYNEQLLQPFASKKLLQEIVQGAQIRFGVSSYACKQYESFFKAPFELMPNLVSNRFIDQKSTELNRDNKYKTFLCIGRFDDNKNQLHLVKAFHKALKTNPNIRLVLVGEGYNLDKIKAFIELNSISNEVTIRSFMPKEKIIEQIDCCDCVVSSSFIETFGLTLVEALFRGKPVISTSSGGPQDIVNDSNGFLVPVNDEIALENAMLKMYANYDTFEADTIMEYAHKNYSESAIISKMIKQYEDCIKKHQN